jgi:oligosaccharide reducing-end xylanase
MIHDSFCRSPLSALPIVVALALACGGAEDGDSDLPPFSGGVPGNPALPGSPTDPGAPLQPGAPDPTQPGGNNETPVTNGGTPLEPGGTGGDPTNNPQPGPDPTAPPDPTPPGPPAVNPPPRSDGVTGTRNLFTELLGVSQGEVDQKLQTAVDRFFGINSTDPATPTLNGGARSFYTLPQDNSMGFIWAADSADIRSEGMSYGMFIALQMDMQQQFDQLWRFAKTFMQQPADSPVASWRHYFRWTGTVNTQNANNWTVNYNPEEPPASDGEEYFAVALFLADRRWGSAGAINYEAEADLIADAMLNNEPGTDGRFPLFHATENQVTFVPYGTSYEHSDPSYHLPAFYEIFAQDGPAVDAARWLEIAEVSRQYFVDSAHPQTGLHPDYAEFDGTPTQGYQASAHDQFQFDAWRVPLNMAVDYAWSREDPRVRTQVEKYHTFFNGNVTASLYQLNGTGGTGGTSQALVAALASGGLASSAGNRMAYVNSLWNIAQPTGNFRYYQGSVYLLGLLATGGRFSFLFPQQ